MYMGQLEAAHVELDKCLSHTPTAVELYQLQAKLLKKSGNLSEAADALTQARTLDLNDSCISFHFTHSLIRSFVHSLLQ